MGLAGSQAQGSQVPLLHEVGLTFGQRPELLGFFQSLFPRPGSRSCLDLSTGWKNDLDALAADGSDGDVELVAGVEAALDGCGQLVDLGLAIAACAGLRSLRFEPLLLILV